MVTFSTFVMKQKLKNISSEDDIKVGATVYTEFQALADATYQAARGVCNAAV